MNRPITAPFSYVDSDSTFPQEIWAACDPGSRMYEWSYPEFNSESLHPHPNLKCFLNSLKN